MSSNEVSVQIRAKMGTVHSDLREADYLIYRIIGMFGQMGLPTNIDQALSEISRLTLSFRMLESSIAHLERGGFFNMAYGSITGIGAAFAFVQSGAFGLDEIFGRMASRMLGEEQMMRASR